MDIRRFVPVGAFALVVVSSAVVGITSYEQEAPPAPPVLSAPAAPTIIEPVTDRQLVSGADVHMETGPFQDPDGHEHRCSDFEIWTVKPAELVWTASCIGGLQILHTHLGDGRFVNSYAGRRDLPPQRDFEVRIRHRDNSADPATEWSPYSVRALRTEAQRKPLAGAPQWRVMQRGYKVEEVASGFQLPVNIAMAPPQHSASPARPLFYVTELYGQIKVVRGDYKIGTYAKDLLNFDPNGKFPGTGEIGLTGIVVEPKTGDIFAAMLYQRGDRHYPKIVRFHSTDGGFTAKTRTTILDMYGEPQEAAHQVSNLTIGPDGKLYVHMGDGFSPSVARKLDSLRGKILRLNLDGSAPTDNPFYNAKDGVKAKDLIFASGFRNPYGGAWRAADQQHYQVENGSKVDRLARVKAGTDYGWNGSDSSMRKHALYNWAPSHAPVNIAFIEAQTQHGSGFPKSKYGNAFVSESGPTYATGPQIKGKRIVEFSFDAKGAVSGPRTLVEYNGYGKSTTIGLAAGPDGLYFTAFYPDSPAVGPMGGGSKIYRIRYVR